MTGGAERRPTPASRETVEEGFTLSDGGKDNGSIKTLVWLWKGAAPSGRIYIIAHP